MKAVYFAEAEEFDRIVSVKEMSDPEILLYACAHCAGFLATCAEDLRQLRQMIHALDREMNPSMPPFEL